MQGRIITECECGCDRNSCVCCNGALDICRNLEVAFHHSLVTGDWIEFDKLRLDLEGHYRVRNSTIVSTK